MSFPRIELRSSQGVTLVELLVAVSLLGMVLGVAYSAYTFGYRSFIQGTEQAALQREARLIVRSLTDEIRYAQEVQVLETVPNAPAPQDIFVYVEDGRVFRLENGKSTQIGDSSGDISASLWFEAEDSHTLEFVLTVSSQKRQYKLEGSITPLNMEKAISEASGSVLLYRSL